MRRLPGPAGALQRLLDEGRPVPDKIDSLLVGNQAGPGLGEANTEGADFTVGSWQQALQSFDVEEFDVGMSSQPLTLCSSTTSSVHSSVSAASCPA